MKATKLQTLRPLAILSLVLLLGVLGCSRSGTVTGKVTFGGQTVPVGTITFHPEKGKAVAVEIVEGEYTAEKVPAGPVTVTVSTALQRQSYNALKSQKDSGQSGGPGLPGGGGGATPQKDSGAAGKKKKKKKTTTPTTAITGGEQ